MSLRTAALSALLVLAAAGPSSSLRFYVDGVSGAGDDRRSVKAAQNQETPWRTITHALRIAHLVPEGRPHVIQIAAGTYTPAMESFPLRVSQTEIYLEASGSVTFDGQGEVGFFEISATTSDFVLKGMSFVNGMAERGGVVYCHTCSLRVVDSYFAANRSTQGGDLIYQTEGRLKFNNNIVRSNGEPGGDAPLIEIHNTFADTAQRDVIRNNTFYRNETPVILTSGNRTDISSNIFSGTSGASTPAIIDSASEGPLVRYNLFWETDVLLVEGQDSIKVARTLRDTLTDEELGVLVPSFVTNEPDTVAMVGSPYVYDIEVMGDYKSLHRFTIVDLPAGASSAALADSGIVRWTPAEADTGRSAVGVEIITPSGKVDTLSYNIRVYTAADFPDTTAQGPQVIVTFVPDTTGAIDSLDAAVPVFSNANSAGSNDYLDPRFLNPSVNRFSLTVASPARDAGNPVVAMYDPLGRVRQNDIGDTGGPVNVGAPGAGSHPELTLQALPDTLLTEGVPWTYSPDIAEPGVFYVADVVTDLNRVPMAPPPTLPEIFGPGKRPPYTWAPTIADTGSYLVLIHAYTSEGSGRQFLPLRVRPENEPPTITSSPPAAAFEDSLLTYLMSASDPNGDAITYSVLDGPPGLTVDEDGTVQWRPTQADLGAVEVQLAATDTKGAAAVQAFTLTVVNTNDAPTLAAVADTLVVEDVLLEIGLAAADVDSADALSWAVVSGADSAAIDSAGVFRWTPLQADVGVNEVTVQVTDLAGASAAATFAVTVEEVDEAPAISSTPDTAAYEDSLYSYAVAAADEEGAIAAYALTVAPAGMAIDTLGAVTWTPTAAAVGDHPVTVVVADSAGQETTQSYTLTVVAVNDLPAIDARSPADTLVVAEPGLALELSVTASDEESATLTYRWLVNGAVQAAAGPSLELVPDSAAADTVVVRVLDGTDSTSTTWIVDGRAIPRLALSADSVDFGAVGLGDTAAVTVNLSNAGYVDLEIANLQVGDLQFSALFTGATVAAGSSAGLQLRFAPTSRGARTSAIQFTTDDPDNDTVSVAVSGAGVVPTVLSLDLDAAAGDQQLLAASAAAGDTIALDIYAERSLELTGYALLVAYDPALAGFASFDLQGPESANLLEAAGSSLMPAVTDPADTLVRVEVTAQAGGAGVSADGILGRLVFVADSTLLTAAELELRLSRAELTSAGQAAPDTVTADPAVVSLSPALVGDFDGDRDVDFDDFLSFADNFGSVAPLYDLDGSGGSVDFDDFLIFVDNFGATLGRPLPIARGEAVDGLAWHRSGGPAEVALELSWDAGIPLSGLALGVDYDAARLRFATYRHAGEPEPLVWVVEDRPGWLLLALGTTPGQGDLAGAIGALDFERLSDGTAEVRPRQALGRLRGELSSRALALPGALTVEALPTRHALQPAYPNPFNPETVLSFALASRARASLRIYDLLGREVAVVVDQLLPRGQHRAVWAARDAAGRPVAGGLYLAELRVGSFRQVRKLMLLK